MKRAFKTKCLTVTCCWTAAGHSTFAIGFWIHKKLLSQLNDSYGFTWLSWWTLTIVYQPHPLPAFIQQSCTWVHDSLRTGKHFLHYIQHHKCESFLSLSLSHQSPISFSYIHGDFVLSCLLFVRRGVAFQIKMKSFIQGCNLWFTTINFEFILSCYSDDYLITLHHPQLRRSIFWYVTSVIWLGYVVWTQWS